MSRAGRRRARREDGFAVLLAVGVGVVLSAVALGLLLPSMTDARIAATFQHGLEARYAADAGAHFALADLGARSNWDGVLDGTAPSAFTDGPPSGVRRGDGRAEVDLDLVRSLADCGRAPPCTDAERTLTTRLRPWGANNPQWQLFAYGPLTNLLPAGSAHSNCYVVVLAADDPLEGDGNPLRDESSPLPGAGVIRLRVEAFGQGGSHRVVEVTVARPDPPLRMPRLLEWREPA